VTHVIINEINVALVTLLYCTEWQMSAKFYLCSG